MSKSPTKQKSFVEQLKANRLQYEAPQKAAISVAASKEHAAQTKGKSAAKKSAK